MTKKFLVSTADVYGYDENENLILVGKTLLDSSIETTLGNTDVRGGRGNQLQYIYYHTAEMTVAINDTQWNLDFLSKNVGQNIITSNNVYMQENITLSAGLGGSVTETPVAAQGTTIYGWVTHVDGTVERVAFSTKAFTCLQGAQNDVVCVRYYAVDSAARSVTIPANIIPSIIRLVLEAQLCSSDAATNVIGSVQIEIPKAALTGAFTISLTPDGVATTPLNARALASANVDGCTDNPVFAYIKEIVTAANWYDNVIGLSIVGGDFSLVHPSTTHILDVRAIPSTGAAFSPPYADLSFASSTGGTATIGAHTGVVTTAGAGTTLLKVSITANTDIDANVLLTVTT